MKNVLLVFALAFSAQVFAGTCEDIPQLKKELQEKTIFLKGYEQAKKEIKNYIVNEYVSYESDVTLELVPDFADKTSFKMNLERIELIKEITILKKLCKN